MNKACLTFQHKLEGDLFILDPGIIAASELNQGNFSILPTLFYRNHRTFKFLCDCILSFGPRLFTKQKYIKRVEERAPVCGFNFDPTTTSTQLTRSLTILEEMGVIDCKKRNKNSKYREYLLSNHSFFVQQTKESKNKKETLDLPRLISKAIGNVPRNQYLGNFIPIPAIKGVLDKSYDIAIADFSEALWQLKVEEQIRLYPNDQKAEGSIVLPNGAEVFYLTKGG